MQMIDRRSRARGVRPGVVRLEEVALRGYGKKAGGANIVESGDQATSDVMVMRKIEEYEREGRLEFLRALMMED